MTKAETTMPCQSPGTALSASISCRARVSSVSRILTKGPVPGSAIDPLPESSGLTARGLAASSMYFSTGRASAVKRTRSPDSAL